MKLEIERVRGHVRSLIQVPEIAIADYLLALAGFIVGWYWADFLDLL